MTSEEKVLEEIKEKIKVLFEKIQELKVTEEDRRAFEIERANYKILIEDYKTHKLAFEKRVNEWNLQHP